jgi:predicted ATPase
LGLDSLPGTFVGRALELAQLNNGLAAAIAGHGRLFLLSGEPGIGKTRLAEEFAAQASLQGMRVMWGRCWEGGGAPAYWPIIQIIRACAERPHFAQVTEALGPGIAQLASLVPEIVRPLPGHGERVQSERLDPETARFQLFDAVATLLKSLARHEPLVLVIDDLHDADVAALQMLRFLNRALKESPVLVVGTHREAEVERSPELRTLFTELARDGMQLPLGGLSSDEVASLLRDRTGVVFGAQSLATLHQTTAGNPLFLHGVMQMLIAEGKLEHPENVTAAQLKIPPNVRGAIQRQLSGLSERTNSMLAVASGLGIDFELAPLTRVTALQTDEILDCLDEGAAMGIVRAVPNRLGHFQFTHALVRATIYDALAGTERIRLHRTIAEVLEDLYRADLDGHLSELAHHYVEAAPSDSAEKSDRVFDPRRRPGFVGVRIRRGDHSVGIGTGADESVHQRLDCTGEAADKARDVAPDNRHSRRHPTIGSSAFVV